MQYVVLVDERDIPIGSAPEQTVHSRNTPLHRGVSVFMFDPAGRVLVRKRRPDAAAFPGMWSTAYDGHPGPEEPYETAATARLRDMFGIQRLKARMAAHGYRFRFTDDNGVVEYEICPVLAAVSDGRLPLSVGVYDVWKWMAWQDFISDIRGGGGSAYVPWCREQAELLDGLGYPAAVFRK